MHVSDIVIRVHSNICESIIRFQRLLFLISILTCVVLALVFVVGVVVVVVVVAGVRRPEGRLRPWPRSWWERTPTGCIPGLTRSRSNLYTP